MNGNSLDNRIENLRLSYPNCYSQTENYRKGKSAFSEKRKVEYLKFKECLHGNAEANLEPSNNEELWACAESRWDIPKSKEEKRKCQVCQNEVKGRSKY
jgi:hypothetical protein